MGIRQVLTRCCDRCTRKLGDFPAGTTMQQAEAMSAKKKLKFSLSINGNEYEYRELCDKCDKRIGDLMRQITLDKDDDLPQVEPIDTNTNSFADDDSGEDVDLTESEPQQTSEVA